MTSRYRIENGVPCVDVKVNTIEQLFDNRDPAPFRERDLDPDLAEYLRDAGEDLASERDFKIVFWVEQPCNYVEVEAALHAHFEFEIDRARRNRREQRRAGQLALFIALLLVVGFTALSEVAGKVVSGSLGAGLKEGLIIFGWVAMWRPVEILIYDWIPVHRARKIATKLLKAPIDVRSGAAAVTASPTASSPPLQHLPT